MVLAGLSRWAGGGVGGRVYRPQSDDRAWAARVVQYWSVSRLGLGSLSGSFESCTSAATNSRLHSPHENEVKMTVLMAGSSGLIGAALRSFLGGRGHHVRRLRRAVSASDASTSWNPADGTFTAGAFDGVDAVVHLAGESIAGGRWTAARKARIRESRVTGTRQLCEKLARLDTPPKVLVAASA